MRAGEWSAIASPRLSDASAACSMTLAGDIHSICVAMVAFSRPPVTIVLCPSSAQPELVEELRARLRSLGADPQQAAYLAEVLLAFARLHLLQITSRTPPTR